MNKIADKSIRSTKRMNCVSERVGNNGYVPNIDGFFYGKDKKTLNDIILSQDIKQEEIILKVSDIYDSDFSHNYHTEKDLFNDKDIAVNISKYLRVNLINNNEIFLYCYGKFVEKCTVVSMGKRLNKKKPYRIDLKFALADMVTYDISDHNKKLIAFQCPVGSNVNIKQIEIFGVIEHIENDVRIIKCGIVMNV